MTADRLIGGTTRIAAALAALLLGAGCATTETTGHARHHHHTEVVAADDPRHPRMFNARVRARVDDITRNISDQVAAGELPHDALVTADGQRQYIEELLARYGTDNFIDEDEAQDVATQIVLLRELRDHAGPGEQARGGGPPADDLWR